MIPDQFDGVYVHISNRILENQPVTKFRDLAIMQFHVVRGCVYSIFTNVFGSFTLLPLMVGHV